MDQPPDDGVLIGLVALLHPIGAAAIVAGPRLPGDRSGEVGHVTITLSGSFFAQVDVLQLIRSS
jgi:hypothetical protein